VKDCKLIHSGVETPEESSMVPGSKIKISTQKFGEAWTSCLLCMVQGDLSVLTLNHAIVAGKTGFLTAISMFILLYVSDKASKNEYYLAGLTGVMTMFADMIIHPPHYIGEPLITGLGAAVLGLIVGRVVGKSS
jgi:hypothetical protein